ncbi:2'-5' RNA ligase family protein [Algoriphagus aestuarii]|nr:2'-5' RNA ligase family protein [Algoriphagus aestuarii]
MANFQKYFLAIVPEGELQGRLTDLKELLRDRFGIKYALKSPAHVTLKMPFSFNEAKEDYLLDQLKNFLSNHEEFTLTISGIHTFGNRVVYLGIENSQELLSLQKNLLRFCRIELKLIEELSDKNYHPHLTMAFKDLKKTPIPNIIKVLNEKPIYEEIGIKHLFLLKRVDGRWVVCKNIPLGAENSAKW